MAEAPGPNVDIIVLRPSPVGAVRAALSPGTVSTQKASETVPRAPGLLAISVPLVAGPRPGRETGRLHRPELEVTPTAVLVPCAGPAAGQRATRALGSVG